MLMAGGGSGPSMLLPGTVKAIIDSAEPGSQSPPPSQPWLQILALKPLDKEPNQSGSGCRYKIALSDSVHYTQGIVMTSLNAAIEAKKLEVLQIVRVTKYTTTVLKGHRLILVGDVDFDGIIPMDAKCGNPTAYLAGPPQQTESIASSNSISNNISNNSISNNSNSNRINVPTSSSMPSNTFPKKEVPPPQKTQGTGDAIPVQPISSLSPYHNRWMIKARVTHKSEIKSWANAKGEGKLFSATLVDDSGEIRCTGFNEACEKFHDLLQVGHVYTLSHAAVKLAKRQFNNVQNDYEIHLEPSTVLQVATDDIGTSVPSIRYNFCPISQIQTIPKDSIIDVIGIVKDVGELGSITTKTTGKQLSKRDLTLVDQSGSAIRMTLWGGQAEGFSETGPAMVMAVKGARVSDYNNRTLSTLSSSTVSINPTDLQEAFQLRGWYDSQGRLAEPNLISQRATAGASEQAGSTSATGGDERRKTLAAIKDEHMGHGDRPEYLSVVASVSYIKSDGNISYAACPAEGCAKKVTEEGPQMWRCERCNKTWPRCDHRYVLSVQLADPSGQTWANAFNETGSTLLGGKTAEDLYYMKQSGSGSNVFGQDGSAEYAAIFKEALYRSYLFRLRIKMEMYQGESKIRVNIISAVPLNYPEEVRRMSQEIEEINNNY